MMMAKDNPSKEQMPMHRSEDNSRCCRKRPGGEKEIHPTSGINLVQVELQEEVFASTRIQ